MRDRMWPRVQSDDHGRPVTSVRSRVRCGRGARKGGIGHARLTRRRNGPEPLYACRAVLDNVGQGTYITLHRLVCVILPECAAEEPMPHTVHAKCPTSQQADCRSASDIICSWKARREGPGPAVRSLPAENRNTGGRSFLMTRSYSSLLLCRDLCDNGPGGTLLHKAQDQCAPRRKQGLLQPGRFSG